MTTITAFYFAIFLSGTIIACFRWFGWFRPMSLHGEMIAGGYIVGLVVSGIFLLTAKSARPESYQWRMIALLLLVSVPQLIDAFLQ
ncbi:MAG: hypothetical protein ABSD64_03170 [Terriglobales bacterium]|jgi:hypothetical protein